MASRQLQKSSAPGPRRSASPAIAALEGVAVHIRHARHRHRVPLIARFRRDAVPDVRDQAVLNDEADVAPPALRQQRIAEMKCRHWRPRRSRPSLRRRFAFASTWSPRLNSPRRAPAPRREPFDDPTSTIPATIRAARGTELSAKSWLTEAPLRMLMNNLDPEVAERPERARRLWRHRPGGARLGELRPDRRARSESSRRTRRCWCSPASRSACSARTPTRRACSSPTPTSCRTGRPGSISTSSTARA